MHRLTGDRGAVTTVVAVFLATGVLFGLGAAVIDVGRLHGEREQLQSGADAAAWRFAEACIAVPAAGNCATTDAANSVNRTTLGNGNAKDGFTEVLPPCGKAPGLTAAACTTYRNAAGRLANCNDPVDPALLPHYVEVRTRTRTAGGGTAVRPALAGGTVSVGACSRVAWGPLAGARVSAIAVSACTYNTMTANGTTFLGLPGTVDTLLTTVAPLLGLPAPPVNPDQPIGLFPVNLGAGCLLGGGFAWLDHTPASGCFADVTVGGNAPARNVIATYADCTAAVRAAVTAGTPLLVAVFDAVQLSLGLVASVHVVGIAYLMPTASLFPLHGGTQYSTVRTGTLLQRNTCGLAVTGCVGGYFSRAVVPRNVRAISATATTDYGTTVITRAG